MIRQTAEQTTKSTSLTTARTNNLAVKPFNRAAKAAELLQKLQTTLDLEAIIDMFSGSIQEIIPHEGYSYQEAELDYSIQEGRQSRHRIAYNLIIQEEMLGTLTLFRNWKFTPQEMEQLEALLPQILYPLRNALKYHRALEHAYNDKLTGLRNRTSLEMEGPRTLEMAARANMDLCVMMIDIDHFKKINDSYGHLCGDKILKRVGKVINDVIRGSDEAYRFGGEELAVILPNADANGAVCLAERIRNEIRSLEYCNEDDLNVTVSIGIAQQDPKDGFYSLIERADQALYEAKHTGRNRVCVKDALIN